MTDTLTLESQFGDIEYTAEAVLTFPDGLFGYEQITSFLLHDHPQYRPFGWLIAVDNPELMFPVIAPSQMLPDYNPDFGDMDEGEQPFVIVAIGDNVLNATMNLRAPILISQQARTGRQIILTDSNYSLRHPFRAIGE